MIQNARKEECSRENGESVNGENYRDFGENYSSGTKQWQPSLALY
jgi:hypothetical protein